MTRAFRPAILLAALLHLGPGAAQAQEAASQACYVPASGTVYVIGLPGSPEACADGHTPVTLQGPLLPGYQIVEADVNGAEGFTTAQAAAACPAGKLPVGGGAVALQPPVHVAGTRPIADAFGGQWLVTLTWDATVSPPITGAWGLAYVICLSAN